MRFRDGIRLGLAVTVSLVMGCSTREPLNSWFDEDSALTFVALQEPVVAARPVIRVSVSGRDYAYLGPLEMNQMGRRNRYLWLGMASTVDRAFAGKARPLATQLVLDVDGLLMDFALQPWSSDSGELPYPVSTPVYKSFVTRVSMDQIDRIAAAESVSVRLVMEDGTAAGYRLWAGGWTTWSAFVAAN